jgi:hypothetical protein
MEWLRFSNLAIGSFPTGILLCVLTIFLLTIKKKSLSTWVLIGYFSVLSILLLSYVFRYSILSTFVLHTGQVSNLIVFGIVSYLLFAYLFQENIHPSESKIVVVLFTIAAIYVYISNFWRYPELERIYDFKAHYYTYVFGPRVSIVTGLGYVWIIVLFFRKTVSASEYSGPLTTWLAKSSLVRRLGARFLIVLVKMVRPTGKKAKSLQALALLTLGMFSLSFLYILMSTEVISRETYGFFFNTGGLLTTFAIFIVYTNYTFDPSSFRWKLVGVSLAPIMLIFGIIFGTTLTIADRAFDNRRKLEVENIKTILIEQDLLNLPPHVVYVASRLIEDGGGSGAYVLEKSRETGLQVIDFIESDRFENEPDRQAFAGQERLFRYFDLYDKNTFFIHYDFLHKNRLYEIGYSYDLYRRVIHRAAGRLFYITAGTTIIVIILFPLFFYRSLFKLDLRIF